MRSRPANLPALPRNAPVWILSCAVIASVVLLLAIASGWTFFQDEWNMTIHRSGFNADAFFLPNDVHPVPIPVAIYKLGLAIFGMSSVGPERVVSIFIYAATAVLLFAYVRRRLGDWLALFPAIVLLFFGPGWNVLLWPFEMTLAGSLAAGLGALLALERDDRTGDAVACLLIVIATGCSSLGVPFALAAGVDVLLRRESRGIGRLYVAAVPLFLYAVWYLTYGNDVPSALSLSNLAGTPVFVAESIASALASLTGLSTLTVGSEGGGSPDWGRPLLIALVVFGAIWLRRGHRVSPRIWVVGTAAAAYWVLGGLNYIPGREPTASRYQYIGAVFIVLIAAEVFRDHRPKPRAIAIFAGIGAVVVLSNAVPLKDGRGFFDQQSELARGELAAIEIARDSVDPNFALTPEIAGTASLTPVDAGAYLDAVDEFGSPAEATADLPKAPAEVRRQVDVVLVHALPVVLVSNAGRAESGPLSDRPPMAQATYPGVRTAGGCLKIAPGAAGEGVAITLVGSTTFELAPGPEAQLSLRRYGDEFGTESPLRAGSRSLLRIPPDRSEVPWQAQLRGDGGIVVCTRGHARTGAG